MAQIAATLMLLRVLSLRNFAVGNTFAKTETVQAAPSPCRFSASSSAFSLRRRLMDLEPEWRAAVLDARLLAGMAVEPGTAQDGVHAEAVLYCARSGQGTTTPALDKLVTVEAPTEKELAAQVHCVQSYADLRGERVAEIGVQTQDLVSFFGMPTGST